MKMKANEVRKMSAKELETKLLELKKDLFNLRLQVAQLGLQLGGAHLTDFICLHHSSPPISVSAVSFFTILHLTGNL